MPINNKVRQGFAKASDSYNINSYIQLYAAKLMISQLYGVIDDDSDMTIVDLGSGTGHVANVLNDMQSRRLDLAIDFSDLSLSHDNLSLNKIAANINELPFASSFFDKKLLILSSFALQWLSFDDIRNFLFLMQENLVKGSYIAISIPVAGSFDQFNIANIESGCNFRFNKMHESKDLLDFVKQLDLFDLLFFQDHSIDLAYDSAIDFIHSIKNIGAGSNFESKNYISTKNFKKINDILKDKYHNKVKWKVLQLVIRKN